MVHDLHDAQDVFQQASVTMWERFGDFEIGTNFVAWASAIVRNKALNLLASRRSRQYVFSPALLEQLAEHVEGSAEYQGARLNALAQCREKLLAKDQILLKECYGGEGTIGEAAKRIGRSPDSVYHSLIRIRRTLLECIQNTLAKEGYA